MRSTPLPVTVCVVVATKVTPNMRLPHLRVPNVPVYDKGVHEKLLSASFQFCEQYAVEFAASLAEGGAGGGQGEGTGKGNGKDEGKSKGRAKAKAKTKAKTKVPKSRALATSTKPPASKASPKTPKPTKAAHKAAAEPTETPTPVPPADTVRIGDRVCYHFGSVGWVAGEVEGRCKRGGWIYEAEEEAEDRTSAAMAWRVHFDDGDDFNVDLSLSRRSEEARAGHWKFEGGLSGTN